MLPSLINTRPTGSRIESPALGSRPLDPILEVDTAVRSVLAGFARGASRQQPAGAVFAERLLALRHVEALPSGTREVRIAPGTVVTPLARDFLKRQGIALRFVARGELEVERPRGEWGFAIEVESGTVAAWRRLLLEEDWDELDPLPGSVARWVIESPNRGALLVTDEASVAVWRACQVTGVRAASAVDPDSVARAVRQLGVNLLVIEPAGKSISLLKQMSVTLRRAGAPEAPDWLDREVCSCGSPR